MVNSFFTADQTMQNIEQILFSSVEFPTPTTLKQTPLVPETTQDDEMNWFSDLVSDTREVDDKEFSGFLYSPTGSSDSYETSSQDFEPIPVPSRDSFVDNYTFTFPDYAVSKLSSCFLPTPSKYEKETTHMTPNQILTKYGDGFEKTMNSNKIQFIDQTNFVTKKVSEKRAYIEPSNVNMLPPRKKKRSSQTPPVYVDKSRVAQQKKRDHRGKFVKSDLSVKVEDLENKLKYKETECVTLKSALDKRTAELEALKQQLYSFQQLFATTTVNSVEFPITESGSIVSTWEK